MPGLVPLVEKCVRYSQRVQYVKQSRRVQAAKYFDRTQSQLSRLGGSVQRQQAHCGMVEGASQQPLIALSARRLDRRLPGADRGMMIAEHFEDDRLMEHELRAQMGMLRPVCQAFSLREPGRGLVFATELGQKRCMSQSEPTSFTRRFRIGHQRQV